ncbi:hypothetical protein [Neobacillus sp. D3-1R]|uniref:hypothetical protein n=1 Tax=Neobacillus sp. D3-1R TaxID=3445778 RepID=UPI003FA03619
MKKIISAIITATLLFSPVGSVVFQDHTTTVEAKGYKSGKRSFNTNKSPSTNSFFQKKSSTTNKSTVSPYKKKSSSGLMKGLMLGGLAGLLFGGLFANMGFLGSMLGLMVNIIGILILISIVRKLFTYYVNKKVQEERNSWRN